MADGKIFCENYFVPFNIYFNRVGICNSELLAYFLCVVAAVVAVTLGLLPRRNYFSVAAMEAEDAALEETNNKQEERKDK